MKNVDAEIRELKMRVQALEIDRQNLADEIYSLKQEITDLRELLFNHS